VCHSAPVKEIAEKFQLTNIHTPRAALPQTTNPSHRGTAIAAPLQTAFSPLRGKAICRKQPTPSPCKLPRSLQKYRSTNPQIRNSPQPSQEGEQHALALRLPTHCHQERRANLLEEFFLPESRRQPIPFISMPFIEQSSGLLGVVSPPNGVK